MTTVEITPEKIAALEAENARLSSELAEKMTIIEELLRRLYRPKTERVDPDQLRLFEQMLAAKTPAPIESIPVAARAEKAEKPGHGRASFPERLPRETTVTDLDEKDRVCSTCGAALKSIGVDACERGHIQPVKIIIRRHEARKYACPNGHEVKTAAGAPKGLVDRAKWTTESYAHIVIAKYQDHQPLERIEKTLKRHGIELPASTMNSMADVVAEKLEPIVAHAKSEILEADHIEADATGIDTFYEAPGKSPGAKPTKKLGGGHFWVWRAGAKLLFDFHPSEGAEAPLKFLKGWKGGTLLVDGSKSFDAIVLLLAIVRAGCWAHVRRKFIDALDLKIADACFMIRLIARLYWIEAAIKKRTAKRGFGGQVEEDALRLRIRMKRSAKTIVKIDAEVRRLRETVRPLPKSPLGKALTYIENQWPRLSVFLADPKVSIDNNAVERAIRPVALGRRNYLFAGSQRGARNAAILYSILNTCVALGINSYDYLVDVLERVSPNADLRTLTPWAWQERRRLAESAAPAELQTAPQ